jgi:hypothetical protein
VVADDSQRLLGVGKRQQIVEKAGFVARPRQMLGEQARFVAADQPLQALEMVAVERPRRADRQADAVQGERIVGA